MKNNGATLGVEVVRQIAMVENDQKNVVHDHESSSEEEGFNNRDDAMSAFDGKSHMSRAVHSSSKSRRSTRSRKA